MLRLNIFGDNFVICAPILVIFSFLWSVDLRTNLAKMFPPHVTSEK